MDFRTKVDIPAHIPCISHQDNLLLLGSCFAEHIGERLADAKFKCDINPFGILYNPASILSALQRISDGKPYTAADLFRHNEMFRSFAHHGAFASPGENETLNRINTRLETAHAQLPTINYLMITLGTSWVYRLKATGQVVSNCHKMPSGTFERTRLDVDDIVTSYTIYIEELKAINPTCKWLFTVSPVRHLKDGAHGNQLSKAILLLAIDELCDRYPGHVFYFPAYELVLDELRDYRFYADDMTHPSAVAIEYAWERFADTFFSAETRTIVNECRKIQKSLRHRPLEQASGNYMVFLKQLLSKIEELEDTYPNLNLEKEKEQCHILSNL